MHNTRREVVNLPYPRSYWVIPGKFLAGCYPGSLDPAEAELKIGQLVACGIRSIICLMEEDERDWSGNRFVPYAPLYLKLARDQGLAASWHRHPIQDQGVPTKDQMKAILDRLDESLSKEHPVFIHCWGGKGRTGMAVGCWLARHGVAEGVDLLKIVQYLRRHDPKGYDPSPETADQRRFVLEWSRGE